MKLIIFDLDGTLVDRDTEQPLSHVVKYFLDHGGETKYAIATNQGGVGLRYWQEQGNFGEPTKYPTEGDAIDHIVRSLKNCAIPLYPAIYVCYAYLSKKGQWSPIPPGKENDCEWLPTHRKPNPGMLLRAINNEPCERDEALFVGDSSDDEQAAIAANIPFQWAWEFFNREKPSAGE